MADMTTLRDIVNSTLADATDVEFNFNTIESYIGASVVRTDSVNSMAADLDLDSNKITNLADPTAAGDAVNKSFLDGQLDGRTDYSTVGSTVVTTSPTTLGTLTIEAPSDGLAKVYAYIDVTLAGATGVDVSNRITLTISLSGVTTLGEALGTAWVNWTSNSTKTFAAEFLVQLTSGTNTITVRGLREDDGTATGGTLTVGTASRLGAIGMF